MLRDVRMHAWVCMVPGVVVWDTRLVGRGGVWCWCWLFIVTAVVVCDAARGPIIMTVIIVNITIMLLALVLIIFFVIDRRRYVLLVACVFCGVAWLCV